MSLSGVEYSDCRRDFSISGVRAAYEENPGGSDSAGSHAGPGLARKTEIKDLIHNTMLEVQ